MVKLLVVLSTGVPLSVTRILTVLMLGACVNAGVQEIPPDADTVSPGGALTRAKVRLFAGRSASVATALVE